MTNIKNHNELFYGTTLKSSNQRLDAEIVINNWRDYNVAGRISYISLPIGIPMKIFYKLDKTKFRRVKDTLSALQVDGEFKRLKLDGKISNAKINDKIVEKVLDNLPLVLEGMVKPKSIGLEQMAPLNKKVDGIWLYFIAGYGASAKRKNPYHGAQLEFPKGDRPDHMEVPCEPRRHPDEVNFYTGVRKSIVLYIYQVISTSSKLERHVDIDNPLLMKAVYYNLAESPNVYCGMHYDRYNSFSTVCDIASFEGFKSQMHYYRPHERMGKTPVMLCNSFAIGTPNLFHHGLYIRCHKGKDLVDYVKRMKIEKLKSKLKPLAKNAKPKKTKKATKVKKVEKKEKSTKLRGK